MGDTYQGVARLLVEYRRRTGASYADIAARTGLGRSTVGFLINTPPPVRLDRDTIEALHTGLEFPREVLARAAWITLGWAEEDTEPDLPDEDYWLARRIHALPDAQRQGMLALLASFEQTVGA